ncbi:hypothetical protein ALTER154_70467 [Alteromonas sp. 154]|nr:hypothetical protein ALTER154_70467 [Alteromonas sp. 154]
MLLRGIGWFLGEFVVNIGGLFFIQLVVFLKLVKIKRNCSGMWGWF